MRAEAPPLLDARTRAEAQAAIESARAALGRARAEEQRAQGDAGAGRARAGARPRAGQGRPDARSRRSTRARPSPGRRGVASTPPTFAVRAASRSCSAPRRGSRRRAPTCRAASSTVTSPVDGVVLKRLRESESVVPAGEPLLEIGDPAPARDRRRSAVDRCRARQARRAGDDRAVGRRQDARGAGAPDRAGRLHEDLGARRRGAARQRRARLRRSRPTRGRRSATPIASRCASSSGRRRTC